MVIVVPINCVSIMSFFDTYHIDDVIDLVLRISQDVVMIIKSTILVGYTTPLYIKHALKLLLNPELKDRSTTFYSLQISCVRTRIFDNLSQLLVIQR